MTQENSELKVTVYWGDILYDTAICRRNETITVGRDPGNTFILDLPAKSMSDSFKLVRVGKDNTAELRFDDHIDGHVRFGAELLSFASAKDQKQRVSVESPGVYNVKLSQADKADVVIGHVSFYLDWVKPASIEKVKRSKVLGWRQALFLLFLLLVSGGVIFLSQTITVPEPEKPPERLVTLAPRPKLEAKAALGQVKTADGGAEKGDLGKADAKPVEKPSAAQQLKKANLGSLVSGLTSLGNNAPALKTASNTSGVNQQGTGGFSTEGLKKGGGGKSVGIGRTVGQGEGGFEGTGRLGLSGNATIDSGTGHGRPQVQEEGGLDRDVIDSIIRRRQDRIRLCYERQLNFHPKLAGKISVHFVIGRTGNVIESRINEDTMKNPSVASCILQEVRSWTFPPPKGGTIENVDYPFVFESSSARGA